MRIGHHSHTVRRKLVEQNCPGPNEGQGGWTTNMHVDLDKIKYEVKDTKKKKGVEKKISPEDQFLMAGVQPAAHTKHTTNDYALCV